MSGLPVSPGLISFITFTCVQRVSVNQSDSPAALGVLSHSVVVVVVIVDLFVTDVMVSLHSSSPGQFVCQYLFVSPSCVCQVTLQFYVVDHSNVNIRNEIVLSAATVTSLTLSFVFMYFFNISNVM